MSYKKYIDYKEKIKVEINSDKYAEHVRRIVHKKDYSVEDIICKEEISSLIKETYYPQSETLRIALFSKDRTKIEKQIEKFKEWNKSKNKEIIEVLNLIESSPYIEKKEKDAELLIRLHEQYCKKKLGKLANKLECALNKIKWKNHTVKIEAIPLEESTSIEEALLMINNEATAVLDLETLKTHTIKESIYKEECNKLVEKTKELKEQKKISSFYLDYSLQNKKIIESMRNDILLGIKCYIPEGIILRKEINENSAWHLKIDETSLVCLGDKYTTALEDTQVKYIERI